MAKAFKKKGNPTETIPVATTIEKVGDTEYGVADYMGRKTYFEKDDNGVFSIPSQDSELNPHFFPGYDKKSGTIDNSTAVQRPDLLTPSQQKKVRKAFRKEITFNKSMDKAGQYNVGDKEMLRNDQDPNNPQFASIGFVPFANNVMPGDESFLASMRDATFAQQNFNQEEIDQNIGNMMRQNGWSYEQAYESVYGVAPTGAVPEQFAKMQSNRQNAMANGDQQAQIDALVASGMSLADATTQITTGTPVNQTVLPTGAAMGIVDGKRQVIMPSAIFQNQEQQNMGGVVPTNYKPKPFRKQTTVGNTTQEVAQPVEYNPSSDFFKKTSILGLRNSVSQTSVQQQAPVKNENPQLSEEQARAKKEEIFKSNFGVTDNDDPATIVAKVKEWGPFVYGSKAEAYPFMKNNKRYYVTRDGEILNNSEMEKQKERDTTPWYKRSLKLPALDEYIPDF